MTKQNICRIYCLKPLVDFQVAYTINWRLDALSNACRQSMTGHQMMDEADGVYRMNKRKHKI